MKRYAVVFLILAGGMLAPRPATSQSIWLPRDTDRSVTLEFLKPDFDGFDEDFMTGAAFLSARLPVSPKLSFIGQIPYAQFGPGNFGETDQALGNVYVGLESHGTLFEEFGIYVPTSSGNSPNALGTGLVSDVARWEAYFDDAVTAQAALHYRRVSPSHLMLGLRVGPAVLFPQTSGADTEVFANYSGRIGYEGRVIRAGAALTGRILVTDSALTGSERNQNQIEVHADVGSRSVRPGIELKIPLGDLGETVPTVLGVSLTLVL
jgi:hypothetical protein